MRGERMFEASQTVVIRAVLSPRRARPSGVDLAQAGSQATPDRLAWLRHIMDDEGLAETLELASPALTARVSALLGQNAPDDRKVRRAAVSVYRYLRRGQSRATPFGLFAGVTTAHFGLVARADWREQHHATVGASAQWLETVITRLEAEAEVLRLLPVMASSSLTIRAGRVVVPYRSAGTVPVEVSLRATEPVRLALGDAQAPIVMDDLADKVLAEFPQAGPVRVQGLLAELVARGALITGLRAPGTHIDPFGHLLSVLDTTGAASHPAIADDIEILRQIADAFTAPGVTDVRRGRASRRALAATMRHLVTVDRHPLAVDVRLDADVDLPRQVAREIECVAEVLTRVSAAPYGNLALKEYHQRFYERFGIGSLVPVLDVVADSGIGYPDGYATSTVPAPRPRLTGRDEALLRLVQGAALDGRREVVLDDAIIASLAVGVEPARVPGHLEVGVRVHSHDLDALNRGDFDLEVVSVSRGAGVTTGRFLHLLEADDRAALTTSLRSVPRVDENTTLAQLSFPPLLAATTHVTRVVQVHPLLISVDEHRAPSEDVLTPADLAVGCDGRRLYLAAPSLGCRVEAVSMHALSLHAHTPPLARLLTELGRAQAAAVFDWGAASAMPFLPRLRHGRTIIAPAQWRLDKGELPGATQQEWDTALASWRDRRDAPGTVYLTEGDRRLRLDLTTPQDRTLLRTHLEHDTAVVTEAIENYGWCGGRAHEVTVPVTAVRPHRWSPIPAPTPQRILPHRHGMTPGASTVLLASLYGDIRRQDEILTRHLPELLTRLDGRPWWFLRYRDPDQHLRLRVHLDAADEFGPVAAAVSGWADELREAGLVREIRYSTSYPEHGRWGSGDAWAAAEDVFRADSRALLAQFTQPRRPTQRTLVVANTIAIASGYLGGTAPGARWLIDNIPAEPTGEVPRRAFTEAVRLADPRGHWSALRAAPGGAATVDAWAQRDTALTAYRACLPGRDMIGIDGDDVLTSLLHAHFVRAIGIDFTEEATCMYLARCAALAWIARALGRTP